MSNRVCTHSLDHFIYHFLIFHNLASLKKRSRCFLPWVRTTQTMHYSVQNRETFLVIFWLGFPSLFILLPIYLYKLVKLAWSSFRLAFPDSFFFRRVSSSVFQFQTRFFPITDTMRRGSVTEDARGDETASTLVNSMKVKHEGDRLKRRHSSILHIKDQEMVVLKTKVRGSKPYIHIPFNCENHTRTAPISSLGQQYNWLCAIYLRCCYMCWDWKIPA